MELISNNDIIKKDSMPRLTACANGVSLPRICKCSDEVFYRVASLGAIVRRLGWYRTLCF